jgi:uncharacterized protein YdaU (DUF1376 family)
MNYYEHHIGDYDEATSHLTACEDGIYSRLIRKYMAKEQPLPDDLPALQRLVRARTREEKSAVASILTEFFYLADGFWHQKTCDEAIEKFRDGEPEREVKKANESNRLKRHREERAALFRALTEAGEHAPWNIGMAELRALVTRVSGASATTTETTLSPLPETAPATPATATQAPVPNTQYPEEEQTVGNRAPVEHPHTRAKPAELSAAMRKHSVSAQPGDPRVIAAAEAGVTVEALEAACEEAKRAKPDDRINAGYVLKIAERWTAEAASPRKPQAPRMSREDERRAISERNARAFLNGHEADPTVIDMEMSHASR